MNTDDIKLYKSQNILRNLPRSNLIDSVKMLLYEICLPVRDQDNLIVNTREILKCLPSVVLADLKTGLTPDRLIYNVTVCFTAVHVNHQ